MSLNTVFQGIAENKTDERIDALHQEIQRQLEPKLTELRQTLALVRNTSNWYSNNAADQVYASYQNGQTIERDTVESGITVNNGDLHTSDGSNIISALEAVMSKRPNPGVITWLQGQARAQKEDFLTKLKHQGETILANASTAIENANTRVTETREAGWQNFSDTLTFYTELANAVTQNDHDALISALEVKTAASASVKSDLISRPLAGQPTGMLAIASMDFDNPNHESETVARVLSSIGNDFEALKTIQETVSAILDEDQKAKYQKYASAFAGMFVPVGNDVLNTNTMVGAVYEDGKLIVTFTGGYKGSHSQCKYPMDKAHAQSIIDTLSDKVNFLQIRPNEVINSNTLVKLENDGDQLHVTVRGGYMGSHSTTKYTIDEEASRKIIQKVAERPNYEEVSEGVVFNTNALIGASYDDQKLTLRVSGGYKGSHSTYEYPLDAAQSQAILASLSERPNFISVNDREAVNANTLIGADYNQEQLQITVRGGYSGSHSTYVYDLKADKAQAVLAELSGLPHFEETGTGSVVNTNMMIGAVYGNDQLALTVSGGYKGSHSTYKYKVDREQARVFLTALEERKQYIQVATDEVVNTNALIGADYEDGQLRLTARGGYKGAHSTYKYNMGEDAADQVLSALEKLPSYLKVADKYFVNANTTIGVGHDDEGKLNVTIAGGYKGSHSTYKYSIGKEQAAAFIKSYRQLGQRMGILSAHADQRDELLYGLREARAWESAYGSSHDNSSTLIDYLPLIIVGAIILFDRNEQAHAEIHGMEGFDGDTKSADIDASAEHAETFDGMGMDDDFASASGLDGTQDTVEHDLGVDSFEADFSDMTTGADAGGLDDFDAGGSGMDTSSDIGGGDFGGYDFD